MARRRQTEELPFDGPHEPRGENLRAPLLPWMLLAGLLLAAVAGGVMGWRRMLADAEARTSVEDARARIQDRLEDTTDRLATLEKQLEEERAKAKALAAERDEVRAQYDELRQKVTEQASAIEELKKAKAPKQRVRTRPARR